MIQDLFAVIDVHVNTPTMLKDKVRANYVVKDRRVAHNRIHRVIGLAQMFKILKDQLHSNKLMPIFVKAKMSCDYTIFIN